MQQRPLFGTVQRVSAELKHCSAVAAALDLYKPLYVANCAGRCRRFRWERKLHLYVCVNCGKADRNK